MSALVSKLNDKGVSGTEMVFKNSINVVFSLSLDALISEIASILIMI